MGSFENQTKGKDNEVSRCSDRLCVEKGINDGMKRGLREGLEKGLEKGIKKGREEGIKKGREEGREEGIQEGLLQVAKKMKAEGMTSEAIAQCTGISL